VINPRFVIWTNTVAYEKSHFLRVEKERRAVQAKALTDLNGVPEGQAVSDDEPSGFTVRIKGSDIDFKITVCNVS
jgi:hypothetical protein